MARLPGELDGQRVLRALGRFGWRVAKVRGSHNKLVHAERNDLIVAFHGTLSANSVRDPASSGDPGRAFPGRVLTGKAAHRLRTTILPVTTQ